MSEPGGFARMLESVLGSEVYTDKGRMRADDQLVRARITRGLSEASGSIRTLSSRWRSDRVPPSTRDQPFPPAEVMEPIRRAERLIRAIDDIAGVIKGLPVLNQDKVWDQIRRIGPNDLLQFDWNLVGESDGLARDLAEVAELDQVDVPGYELRVRRIKDIVGERQRFLEIS